MPSKARLKSQNTVPLDVGGTGKITEFRKGFIDGLRLVYNGLNAVTITAGSAYIPSLGKIIELPNDIAMTGVTLPTALGFTHWYLYDNAGVAAIEFSTTVPVNYYGIAYNKTGDTSRRYIGSLLHSSGGGFYKWFHDIAHARMNYNYGTPSVAPFLIYPAYVAPSAAVRIDVFTASLAPKATATVLHCVHGGAGSVSFSPADQQTQPAASGSWHTAAGVSGGGNSSTPVDVLLARSGVDVGKFDVYAQSGTSALYLNGYTFER